MIAVNLLHQICINGAKAPQIPLINTSYRITFICLQRPTERVNQQYFKVIVPGRTRSCSAQYVNTTRSQLHFKDNQKST